MGVPRAFGLPFLQVAARGQLPGKLVIFSEFSFSPQPARWRRVFLVASSVADISQLALHPLGRLDDSFLAPPNAQTLVRCAPRRAPAVETQIRQRAGEPSSTSNEVTAARIDYATALSKSWPHHSQTNLSGAAPTPRGAPTRLCPSGHRAGPANTPSRMARRAAGRTGSTSPPLSPPWRSSTQSTKLMMWNGGTARSGFVRRSKSDNVGVPS